MNVVAVCYYHSKQCDFRSIIYSWFAFFIQWIIVVVAADVGIIVADADDGDDDDVDCSKQGYKTILERKRKFLASRYLVQFILILKLNLSSGKKKKMNSHSI